jgi:drug/metabolite transporter (DMT)-like permease
VSARATPLIYGVLACLSWAFGSVLTKALLSHIEPLAVLSGQLTASVIGLWGVSLASGSEFRLGDWRIGLPGLLQPGLAYAMSTVGLSLVPASLEAMIFSIETPLILLLAWPLLGERPTRSLTVLGMLAFVGVIILTWRPEIDSAAGHGFAVFLIVSGAGFAALYTIAIRWMSADVDALRLTRASQTVGWLAVIITWCATRQQDARNLDMIDAAMIAGSGLLLNAIPFFLYGVVLERASASFAALLLPLVPVLTAVLAFGVLGETLNALQWCGAMLVLSSVAAIALMTHTTSTA